MRAGELADSTLYYRHDLALAVLLALPKNPHTFASALATFGVIALGAQDQAGRFFKSDGTTRILPEPRQFFEFPIVGPLPEDLNFIR